VRALLAIAALLLAAAPASAQIAPRHDYGPVGASDPFLGDGRGPGPGIGRELRDVRGKIREGRETGQLSRREARQLDRETRRIGRVARRYGRDGLSASEARFIEARLLALRGSVSAARLGPDAPRTRGRR
jgi:hypothetical protein